jgi:hypothetical protein
MPPVQLHVNGVQRAVDAWDAEMPLLYALRNGEAASTPVPAALANAV